MPLGEIIRLTGGAGVSPAKLKTCHDGEEGGTDAVAVVLQCTERERERETLGPNFLQQQGVQGAACPLVK
jgi:hypothetical protein